MDSETLKLLLSGCHLNMEERSKRGIWPHPPLAYSMVRNQLIQLIENQAWFPSDLTQKSEGVVIENRGATFVCYSLTYSAFGPGIVSEKSQILFKSVIEAADFYLKHELRLPGDLDGWKVI
ncbi:hypothetical protein [Gimesia algae]|uniref:Uncharacterized protein n=1 Tax=Gimesia algae TaxID=2527971 RepID=A0A517VJH2_9PLAN|nr:hypothetical protein [Gimesia algae]QDT93156.1 hypothetical protein Pan161_48310 [Gimesia algae]